MWFYRWNSLKLSNQWRRNDFSCWKARFHMLAEISHFYLSLQHISWKHVTCYIYNWSHPPRLINFEKYTNSFCQSVQKRCRDKEKEEKDQGNSKVLYANTETKQEFKRIIWKNLASANMQKSKLSEATWNPVGFTTGKPGADILRILLHQWKWNEFLFYALVALHFKQFYKCFVFNYLRRQNQAKMTFCKDLSNKFDISNESRKDQNFGIN